MYLLDHQNAHAPRRTDGRRFWGYPARRSPVRILVVHTAENLPDFEPPDNGAESVADYGATTERAASWHTVVDSDTTIDCLPDTYTAFHVAGYNSPSLGLELATRAHRWHDVPGVWKGAILQRAATKLGAWSRMYDIPHRRLTKAQVDAGGRGLVAHADLDPKRRSDPGPAFDWDVLFALMAPRPEPITTIGGALPGRVLIQSHVPELRLHDKGIHVLKLQKWLNAVAAQNIAEDGDFGKVTQQAVLNVQWFFNLPDAAGVASAWTWHTLLTVPV